MLTPILSALDVLSLADLRDLVVELSVRVAGLEEENARRREENARLKGLPKKPPLVPGGMDKATSAAPSTPDEAGRRKRRQRRSRTALAVHEARRLTVTPPPGSRRKGSQTYTVRDLVLCPHVVQFRRERWRTPGGQAIVAPLPPEVRGTSAPASCATS